MGCTSSAGAVSPTPGGKDNQREKQEEKKPATPRSRKGTMETAGDHVKVEIEEVRINVASLREVPPSYPPPEPPSYSKGLYLRGVNFTKTDRLASKVPGDVLDSYDQLFQYLTQESTDDLFKVRAILVWLVSAYVQPLQNITGQGQTKASGQGHISTQGHNQTKVSNQGQDTIVDSAGMHSDNDGNVEENVNMNGLHNCRQRQKESIDHTPRLDLDLVHKGQVDLAIMFAFCCRKAGIKCIVIRGQCKPDGYEVDWNMRPWGFWNSVFLNGVWRLIHPHWSIIHTTVEVSRVKDEIVMENPTLKCAFDDYYFLTNPDELITSCLPDNPKWQLLKKPIPSGRFQLMPYFTRHFFKLGLSLSKDKDGILKTSQGKARVDIDFPEGNQPELYYHIAEKEIPSAEYVVMDTDSLRRCVFMFKMESTYSFRLCFKKRGVYNLRIYGGHVKHVDTEVDRAPLLCQLQVDCEEPAPTWLPTPLSPAIGWGQSELGVKFGVIPISHKGGIACTNENRKVNFMFKIAPATEIQANLISSKTSNPVPVPDFVHKDNKAILLVVLPSGEEHCLRVNARSKKENGKSFVNVCNFVVKAQPVPLQKERARDRRLKNMLEAVMRSGTEGQLVKAMNEYTMFVHADTGELDRAEDRLAYFRLKTNLLDAIQRNFVPNLEMTIYDAETSKHVEELKSYIRVAKAHLHHLQRTATYRNHVLTLNQSLLLELRGYMEPSPIIYDVMVAVLLLLGERRANIYEWKYIRSTLSRTGKASILNCMERFHPERVGHDRLTEADAILSQHSLDQVWEASAGAAVIHRWAKDVIGKIKWGDSTQPGVDPNNVDNADLENSGKSREGDSTGRAEDGIEADDMNPNPKSRSRTSQGSERSKSATDQDDFVSAKNISTEFVDFTSSSSTGNRVGGENEIQDQSHSEGEAVGSNDGDNNDHRSRTTDQGDDVAAAKATELFDFTGASSTENRVLGEHEIQDQGHSEDEAFNDGDNKDCRSRCLPRHRKKIFLSVWQ
ncbi:uncharacterized protein [Haliotis cracherodii]|uniref:uncharacterized protein n=1 Tax=Haliotis cracherodii TaxID=6455 RepID=UPI0039E72E84